MKESFIIALDQGTTSSRAILVNSSGNICAMEQREFTQHYPRPGWVEHDPEEIYHSQLTVFEELIRKANIKVQHIAAIGITNQRETTIVWDRHTGQPVFNAIVWQDRRTAAICEQLVADGLTDHIRNTTGLVPDAYFSGPKIKWILDNVDGARKKAESGDLLFGTVDTWLIWKLTEGKVHATDYSNASRTMLYDIENLQWDKTLLKALNIPVSMLPDVRESSGNFGSFHFSENNIPLSGVAGDQQAALFGHACFSPGTSKNTYGTGTFMLMNTGDKFVKSSHGLVSTIAWGLDSKITYALEGSVFIAGAAVQWLRDGLRLIETAGQTEELALRAREKHNDAGSHVYLVPAFAGLGAPHWDMYARGAIFGLTRDTTSDDLARATLESIAYQTCDIASAMAADSGLEIKSLKVDGGASANNYLMSFQSNLLGVTVERPANVESTALGAASLAGLGVGMWDLEKLSTGKEIDTFFQPDLEEAERKKLLAGWHKACQRSMKWIEAD